MKRLTVLTLLIISITLFSSLITADWEGYNYTNSTTNSSSGNSTNSTPITCTLPACEKYEIIGKNETTGCYIYACQTVKACTVPICEGRVDTGKYDDNGCKIYACPTTSPKYDDMNSCLDGLSTNYWDQKNNKCYEGFSKEIIPSLCDDADGGINQYEPAHTYGFRSSFADSRDQRIRTGGKDGCYNNEGLSENYCDAQGFIQTTTIDCPNGCEGGRCIKGETVREVVICRFEGSEKEEECYAALTNQQGEGIKCKGKEKCSVEIKYYNKERVTWKSSCGGYQYTTQDGNDEEITFNCKAGETTPIEIINQAYKGAQWECYNGEGMKGEVESSNDCKTFIEWQKKAEEFCKGKCKGEKCGVNSISVVGECYTAEQVIANSSTGRGASGSGSSDNFCDEYLKECQLGEEAVCEKWKLNCQTTKALICKDSCPLDEKCYPFGYRKKGNYCSDSGSFVEQSKSDSECENNFECSSNVCVSNQCVSEGFIQKIINWFKKIFGGE